MDDRSIRPLTRSDVKPYHELRLRMLRDHPDAFEERHKALLFAMFTDAAERNRGVEPRASKWDERYYDKVNMVCFIGGTNVAAVKR